MPNGKAMLLVAEAMLLHAEVMLLAPKSNASGENTPAVLKTTQNLPLLS